MKRKWIALGVLAAIAAMGLTACAVFMALPEAVLEAVPTVGTVPLEVTFDISGSRGQTFTLDFGDGEETVGIDFATPIPHTYEAPGTYEAELTVADARGNTDTASVTIQVTPPPLNAHLAAEPQTGSAPLTVTFDLSGTVGDVAEYTLITGDGGAYHGTDITTPIDHTYNNPGDYAAVLLVEDIWGQESFDSVMIEVSP